MKGIGALFIVVSAYVFGALLRAGKLREEQVQSAFILFLRELEDNIEYRTRPLREVVALCAANERYEALDFLPETAARMEAGEPLKTALCGAFRDSDCAARLEKGNVREAERLFGEIGETVDEEALQAIRFVSAQVKEALEIRKAQNQKQKGYYEALCSLAGAAVAILLL